METMKVSKQKAKVLESAIDYWQQEQLVTGEQASKLRRSYQVVGFDWKLLAIYSFWIAITCFIISIGILLADDYLLELIAKIIDTPASTLSLASGVIATLFYVAGVRRRNKHPKKHISNEATFFFGVLMTAVSAGFLRETALVGHHHDSLLLLLLTFIYASLGIRLSSILIWLFALLSFAGWALSQSSEWAGASGYFLGMNLPLRFVVVGLLVLALSMVTEKHQRVSHLTQPTRFVGLLYLLSALWLLSIFGNYEDLAAWSQVNQIALIHWSLIAIAGCIVTLYLGITAADDLCRNFGMAFLLINLYTRYFEYFWDTFHKTLFFAVLALSFWLIGSHAEKLWQIGNKEQVESKIAD